MQGHMNVKDEIFLSSKTTTPSLGHTQPPVPWGVKQSGSGADHCRAEEWVELYGASSPLLLYALKA
jgi:hypothetical protein